MKIQNVEANSSAKNIKFGNQRIYKNVISQLAKNNSYSLNELNQRRISDAIIKLGAKENINNADFFLEILKKIKYSTNIKLKHKPKHDWKKLLASATLDSLRSITGTVSAFGFWEKLNEIMENRDLSKEELEILDIRKNLLEAVDTEQVKNETRGPVKDFEKNLDYFIISSETTIEHKKYVLEKLKYFMRFC